MLIVQKNEDIIECERWQTEAIALNVHNTTQIQAVVQQIGDWFSKLNVEVLPTSP